MQTAPSAPSIPILVSGDPMVTADPIAQIVSLWACLLVHQGDEAPLYDWLANPRSQWQPRRLLSALPLAATRWLAVASTSVDSLTAVRTMATFGNAMLQCPLGDPSAQVELAIATYNLVLTHLSPTEHPQDWAITLNNLATAYRQRQTGTRSDHLEQAIHLYRQVLALATPDLWPITLTGLALAYRERILGEPMENLNQAIAAYQQVLTLISNDLPTARQVITQHLALAYCDRAALSQGMDPMEYRQSQLC